MQIPHGKALAGVPPIGHSWFRPLMPGGPRLISANQICSLGGVKVPTGGKGELAQARERLVPTIPLREFWEKGSADSV
jgi:hypothetical protein